MSTTTFIFKLYLAPGAQEKFSLEASDIQNLLEALETRIGDLGLSLDILYCKNPKGNLVSLGENPKKLEKILGKSGNFVSIYAIPDSESESDSSSDSSSGEKSDDDDEVVIAEAEGAPEERTRGRGRCGRRGPGGCRRRGFGGFGRRHHIMKYMLFGRRRHCFGGRRSRSAPPSGPEDIRRRMFGRRRHDTAGEGPRPEGCRRRRHSRGPFDRTEGPEGFGRRHNFFGRRGSFGPFGAGRFGGHGPFGSFGPGGFGGRGPFGPEEGRPDGCRRRHHSRGERGEEGPRSEDIRSRHCGPPPFGPGGFPHGGPHHFGGHHGFGGHHHGFGGHHGFDGHHGFGGRHGFCGDHGFGGSRSGFGRCGPC
ncbi:hypothetical protein CAEBREN_10153 [Caenorhabditis brenneri]|uniref:Uncharacterized protein n=1 Tax=Caenorhabditis brenneri TaxID=135651 RepID=G0PKV0_CAEBE|nr:hypothetical protein CAEBREN_10153 [Caenorhabditis brenneri]